MPPQLKMVWLARSLAKKLNLVVKPTIEKNPYVTPTKNTWTLAACLDANDLYIEAKDQYEVFKDILSASPEGVTELGNLQKSMDSLIVIMKTQTCKKGK